MSVYTRQFCMPTSEGLCFFLVGYLRVSVSKVRHRLHESDREGAQPMTPSISYNLNLECDEKGAWHATPFIIR
jgi:hypothetical protein